MQMDVLFEVDRATLTKERLRMKVVLFLCTGNYYRSRYAEEMFNLLAPAECPGWSAVSRGIAVKLGANNVGQIARATVQALQKRGMNFNLQHARMPLQLEIADLESADHIVALKYAEHFPMMRDQFPSWLSETEPSGMEFWNVHDIDVMPPEQALPLIEEQLRGLMGRLCGGSR
jgi:protein-tyrosine phosphatase